MTRASARRGTILVVVLGILAVLAIVGATMIKVARVDSLAARSYRQGTELELGVESAPVSYTHLRAHET